MHRNALAVTDAARALGLRVEIVEFPAEGARTAADAAAVIGVVEGQIVKSLVFAVGDPGDHATSRPVMALVCGDDQLDVTRLAHAAGAAGAWRMDAKSVRDATGYPVGGIPPFGHSSLLPTFADLRLRRFATVWAAAGTPSHVFEVGVDALVKATGASWAELAVGTDDALATVASPLTVTHPRPTGRAVLGTVPLTARPPQLSALPSVTARVAAFVSILVGGALGGLLTFGVMKVWTGRTSGTRVGLWTMLGAVGCAFGVGVLATLVLRAMSEWRSLNHAEDVPTVLGS